MPKRKASSKREGRARRFVKYISEIITELKKVVWPTRRDTIRLTLMVIAVSVAVGLTLGAVDYGFYALAKLLFSG